MLLIDRFDAINDGFIKLVDARRWLIRNQWKSNDMLSSK